MRASAITSAGPASSEPTGAHSPFERQHMTVTAASPAVAETLVGAPGRVRGVTADEGDDAGPVPAALVAVTVNV